MTTAIPKDVLIENYINKDVRVLTTGGDAYEQRLIGVTTDPEGNVSITLMVPTADPIFTFVDGDDVVRIEAKTALGYTKIYGEDDEPYAFTPLEDPAAHADVANGAPEAGASEEQTDGSVPPVVEGGAAAEPAPGDGADDSPAEAAVDGGEGAVAEGDGAPEATDADAPPATDEAPAPESAS